MPNEGVVGPRRVYLKACNPSGETDQVRFTEQFQVQRSDTADWFDLNVEMDTPLYVDPFLIFDDEPGAWEGAHDQIVDFFQGALHLLGLADGQTDSAHWKKVERFLQFPEPKEFALGLSMGHPEGSGIGADLARDICHGLDLFRQWGRDADDRLLGMVSVLVPGLGVDRISDMVCNILKRRFIDYTQAVCGELQVPVQSFDVPHTGWVATAGRWRSSTEALPASPVFNGAVLLTPERFLKDIPRVTPDGFWSWAEINAGEALRFDLNYDLGVSLTRPQRKDLGRQLARRAPDILENYVVDATEDAIGYDVEGDPKGLVRWEEAGRRIAAASSFPPPPTSQDQFESWLIALAESFKAAIEDEGLWRALWNDDYTKPRPERIAQVIARSTWIPYCRGSNIDMTREAECGRGPVDFKFTQGWEMRGLLEIKYIASRQFVHGAYTQLPLYLQGEQAPFGVYLCIGFTDNDFDEERLGLVRDACASISNQGRTQIVPIFADARKKLSASTA